MLWSSLPSAKLPMSSKSSPHESHLFVLDGTSSSCSCGTLCQFQVVPLSFSLNIVASPKAQPLVIHCSTHGSIIYRLCTHFSSFLEDSHVQSVTLCNTTLLRIFGGFHIIEKVFTIVSPLGFWTPSSPPWSCPSLHSSYLLLWSCPRCDHSQ